MPRIRSIHPGFWTDEAVVSVSRDARLLYIGLWGQCDDKGAFEWKPVSIKMRLFPADDLDIAGLLQELARAGMVRSYAAEGRKFGAIKNFLKFQRPKKPNDIHPMPDAIRLFSKGFPTGSPPVGNRSGGRSSSLGTETSEGGDSLEEIPPLRPRASSPLRGKKREPRNSWVAKGAEIVMENADVEAGDARSGGAPVVDLSGHLDRRKRDQSGG